MTLPEFPTLEQGLQTIPRYVQGSLPFWLHDSRLRIFTALKNVLPQVGALAAVLDVRRVLRRQVRRGQAVALLQNHQLRHLRSLGFQILQPASSELGAEVTRSFNLS